MAQQVNPLRLDPTRTTMLRNAFIAEIHNRFRALRGAIWQLVYVEDAFGIRADAAAGRQTAVEDLPGVVHKVVGLSTVPPVESPSKAPVANASTGRFRFETDDKKVAAYQAWLKQQTDAGILEVSQANIDKPWTEKYIASAYKKGVLRAYTDTHAAAIAGDQDLNFIEGGKKAFLDQAFNSPVAQGKLKMLSTRAFTELKGVTSDMDKEMTRVLTDGLAHGHGADKIAKNLNKSVSTLEKKRARVIARTEVIRAHNEGQLDAFEEMNMEDVGVMAEWSTAHDGLVCPLCAPLEGVVLTIKEARGLLPRHPNCRCAWLPAGVGEEIGGTTKTTWAGPEQGLSAPGTAPTGQTTGQIWHKGVIQDRIRASLKAEFPKLAGTEARAATKWVGGDLTSVSGKLKPGSKAWEIAKREANAKLAAEAAKTAAKAQAAQAAKTLDRSLQVKVGLTKEKYGLSENDIAYLGDTKTPTLKASKQLEIATEKGVKLTDADWAKVQQAVNENTSTTVPYLQKQLEALDSVIQDKIKKKAALDSVISEKLAKAEATAKAAVSVQAPTIPKAAAKAVKAVSAAPSAEVSVADFANTKTWKYAEFEKALKKGSTKSTGKLFQAFATHNKTISDKTTEELVQAINKFKKTYPEFYAAEKAVAKKAAGAVTKAKKAVEAVVSPKDIPTGVIPKAGEIVPIKGGGFTAPAEFTDTGVSLGGSTGAKKVTFADGSEWVLKDYSGRSLQAENEYLANNIYNSVSPGSAPKARLGFIKNRNGETSAAVFNEFTKDGTEIGKLSGAAKVVAEANAKDSFVLDAWLGNWDTVGLGGDNMLVRANGTVIRIDNGGSILFRAQGGLKGKEFGNRVAELRTLLDSKKNPAAAKIFSGITDKQIAEQIDHLENTVKAKGGLSAFLDQAGVNAISDQVKRQEVTHALEQRFHDLLRVRDGIKGTDTIPLAQRAARLKEVQVVKSNTTVVRTKDAANAAMAKAKKSVPKGELSEIKRFTGGSYSKINSEHLALVRKGKASSETVRSINEGLAKLPGYEGTLVRGESYTPDGYFDKWKRGEWGQVFWTCPSSSSASPAKAFSSGKNGVCYIIRSKGKRNAYVQSISHYAEEHEALIMGDSAFKVAGYAESDVAVGGHYRFIVMDELAPGEIAPAIQAAPVKLNAEELWKAAKNDAAKSGMPDKGDKEGEGVEQLLERVLKGPK